MSNPAIVPEDVLQLLDLYADETDSEGETIDEDGAFPGNDRYTRLTHFTETLSSFLDDESLSDIEQEVPVIQDRAPSTPQEEFDVHAEAARHRARARREKLREEDSELQSDAGPVLSLWELHAQVRIYLLNTYFILNELFR